MRHGPHPCGFQGAVFVPRLPAAHDVGLGTVLAQRLRPTSKLRIEKM
jgi:hypothetical protein